MSGLRIDTRAFKAVAPFVFKEKYRDQIKYVRVTKNGKYIATDGRVMVVVFQMYGQLPRQDVSIDPAVIKGVDIKKEPTKEVPVLKDMGYPKWQSAIPRQELVPTDMIAFNTEFISRLHTANKLLADKPKNTGVKCEMRGRYGCGVIRPIDSDYDWYGLVMPMRVSGWSKDSYKEEPMPEEKEKKEPEPTVQVAPQKL